MVCLGFVGADRRRKGEAGRAEAAVWGRGGSGAHRASVVRQCRWGRAGVPRAAGRQHPAQWRTCAELGRKLVHHSMGQAAIPDDSGTTSGSGAQSCAGGRGVLESGLPLSGRHLRATHAAPSCEESVMHPWRHVLQVALVAVLFIAATSRTHTQVANDPTAEFFDDTVLHEVKLWINSRDWETLKTNFL